MPRDPMGLESLAKIDQAISDVLLSAESAHQGLQAMLALLRGCEAHHPVQAVHLQQLLEPLADQAHQALHGLQVLASLHRPPPATG